MAVKGTSVSSTLHFVKTKFSDKLEEWINSLPEESKNIFLNPILSTHWYPMQEGLIIPTKFIGKMFYEGNEQLASRELGKFSAKKGLSGVYSIFIKVAKPGFVLKKSPRIFSTYYSNSKFEIVDDGSKFAIFNVSGFSIDDKIIIDRIEGWIEMVLQIVGEKNFSVKSEISDLNNNEIFAKIEANW